MQKRRRTYNYALFTLWSERAFNGNLTDNTAVVY